MSILPLLLVTLFNIILPFALNANFVIDTNSSPVSSVIVAFIVVLPSAVFMLSVLMIIPFFSRVNVPLVSVLS